MGDVQKKIQRLLGMTHASMQLMKDMTGTLIHTLKNDYTLHGNNTGYVNEIVQTATTEKNRVLKDLKQ